ncbi:MAG: helix-hairpin-helix domain-containing protein, partial [Nakamurella sp.]
SGGRGMSLGGQLRAQLNDVRSSTKTPGGTIGGWVPEQQGRRLSNVDVDFGAPRDDWVDENPSPGDPRTPALDWDAADEQAVFDEDFFDDPGSPSTHGERRGHGGFAPEPRVAGNPKRGTRAGTGWGASPGGQQSAGGGGAPGQRLTGGAGGRPAQQPAGRESVVPGQPARAKEARGSESPSGNAVEEPNRTEDDDGDDDDGDPDATEIEAAEDLSALRPAVRAHRIGRHWGRFAELWVPESLREARVDPGRKGALILLLIATLAATVTAVGVWRDRPESRPVETASITGLGLASASSIASSVAQVQPSGSAQPASSVASGSPPAQAPSTDLVVSVTGLVANPGLVTLPAGARVADAIAAAGGTAADADLTGINLAARLNDGDSVVIGGSPGAPGVASGVAGSGQDPNPASTNGAAGASSELINLNTADEAALDTLPGVGPVMAQNILAWRETNGSFSSTEQLQEISGIGPSRYAQIAPLVTVS